MTNILAIDTSGEACSASLLINSTCITKFEIAPQAHSQLVLQMCDELLQEAQCTLNDLDSIAYCRGPGSFTGLRIGAGIIQGLAYSCDLPVIMVSSLEALAQKAALTYKNIDVLSVIDARMNEIYWARYHIDDKGQISNKDGEHLGVVEDLPTLKSSNSFIGVGSGWETYAKQLNSHLKYGEFVHINNYQYVSAEEIAILAAIKHASGEWVAPEQALPVYLRNNVVHKR